MIINLYDLDSSIGFKVLLVHFKHACEHCSRIIPFLKVMNFGMIHIRKSFGAFGTARNAEVHEVYVGNPGRMEGAVIPGGRIWLREGCGGKRWWRWELSEVGGVCSVKIERKLKSAFLKIK